MAKYRYLSASTSAALQAEPIELRKEVARRTPAPYFVSYVTQQLQHDYGYHSTFFGGLRVTTTLDIAMQRAAERAVADHLSARGDPSAAVVAIDPTTGAIRAMVGGKNFAVSQVNLATYGHGRQAGSAFKPFTLAAAMEDHISLNSYWYGPNKITISDPRCNNRDGTPWEPSNAADEGAGAMSLTNATAFSVNTIFAQLVTVVGPDAVVDVAKRMGITTPLQPYCSTTLGTQSVHPLDMTNAYATLAARGLHHAPTSVWRVRQPSDGAVLFQADPASNAAQVLGQNDADLVTYALQRVIRYGTGTRADIGRPAAGKTGTTTDYHDAWFCGYTPQLATCVWVGYPKNETTPMLDIEGFPEVFGGTIPAEIWHDFMLQALANSTPALFATPSFAGYNTYPSGAIPSPSPSRRRALHRRRARHRHPRRHRVRRRAPLPARRHLPPRAIRPRRAGNPCVLTGTREAGSRSVLRSCLTVPLAASRAPGGATPSGAGQQVERQRRGHGRPPARTAPQGEGP